MARLRITDYVFDPSARTITFGSMVPALNQISSIRNLTSGEVITLAEDIAAVPGYRIVGNVLMLPYVGSRNFASDTLQILYEADGPIPHDPNGMDFAPIENPVFEGTVTTPGLTVTGSHPTAGEVLTSDSVGNATWQPLPPGDAVPATTTSQGSVRLAGDLSGTADTPTVPGLAGKAGLDSPTFTGVMGANQISASQINTLGLAVHTANAGTGKVLTSDAFGNADWEPGGAGGGAAIAVDTPTGTINGSNITFVTAQPYADGTLQVFLNGLAEQFNVGFYTQPPQNFTFAVAPQPGDVVTALYQI